MIINLSNTNAVPSTISSDITTIKQTLSQIMLADVSDIQLVDGDDYYTKEEIDEMIPQP